MIEWTNRIIGSDELRPNEVFVFGSNGQGFHGAGSAGLAMRGDSRNNWRDDPFFLRAISFRSKDGELRSTKGRWADLGVARGYQTGVCGKSYAVQTVTKPGAKRSMTRRQIYFQLVDLWRFALANQNLNFLVTPVGEGYAGYTPAEMDEVWDYLVRTHGLPPNVEFVGRRAGVAMT